MDGDRTGEEEGSRRRGRNSQKVISRVRLTTIDESIEGRMGVQGSMKGEALSLSVMDLSNSLSFHRNRWIGFICGALNSFCAPCLPSLGHQFMGQSEDSRSQRTLFIISAFV